MAIITKGSSVEKGNEVEFTLNITDLLAHASVSGDAYFSVQSNWDKVFVNYTSEGYQKEILIFNNVDSGTSSAANFGVFSNARDLFEVHSIIIMDKQNGCLKIKRSDLVVADFDVDFSSQAPAPSSNGFNPLLTSSELTLSNNNRTITRSTSSLPYIEWSLVDNPINVANGGKYYWEISYDALGSGPHSNQSYFGFSAVNEESVLTNLGFSSNNYPFGFTSPDFDASYTRIDTTFLSFRDDGGTNSVSATNMPTNMSSVGQRLMIALDLDNQSMFVGVDGDWGTANPITNLNGLNIVLSKGFIYPGVACGFGGASFTLVSSPLYQPSGFTLIS